MLSSQPRKQRKALFNAPLHQRQKLVSSNLVKKLREEFGRRSLAVRKGDKVRIMRGEFRGLIGGVKEVDLKALKVTVEKLVRKKVDGTEVLVPLHPSNLQIIEANMEDKERQNIVKRSGGKITVTGEVPKEIATEVKAEKREMKAETKLKEKTEKPAKKTETKKTQFKCPVCKSSFKTKKEVDQHVQKTHKEYR